MQSHLNARKLFGRAGEDKALPAFPRRIAPRSALALTLLLVVSQAHSTLPPERGTPLTFVQITDPHIFDSGKLRNGERPEELQAEINSSRFAWEWSMLQINRLAASRTIDFVAFTGDFGLEKVSTQDKDGCIALSTALDEVARTFGFLRVNTIYLIRGNNDLSQEDPNDFARFDDFVERLKNDPRLKGKTIINLTPGDGTSPSPQPSEGVIRIIGLDSSSFKNEPPKNKSDKDEGCPYVSSIPPKSGSAQEYQLRELKRVDNLVQEKNQPAVLFTHIPDLDDPFKVDHPPANGLVAGWNLKDEEAKAKWADIVSDKRLLAIFAGHLHDPNRYRYLPPYSWQTNRNRLAEVYMKTFLAPPLAAKFQMGFSPQARGFLLATVDASGVTNVEFVWLDPQPINALANQVLEGKKSACFYWIATAAFLGVVLIAVIVWSANKGWGTAKRPHSLPNLENGEMYRFGMVIGFAVLSLLIIWIAKRQLDIVESPILIALVAVPMLIYAVVSGRVAELKGPGGWGATFRAVAREAVEVRTLTGLEGVDIEVTENVPKGDPATTIQKIKEAEKARPVVLTLMAGGDYESWAVQTVIDQTIGNPDFVFVVILDDGEGVDSYIAVQRLRTRLQQDPAASASFVAAVKSRQINTYPGMVTETISEGASNVDALEKMKSLHLDAIIATSKGNKLRGVVERRNIIDRMMLALANSAKG